MKKGQCCVKNTKFESFMEGFIGYLKENSIPYEIHITSTGSVYVNIEYEGHKELVIGNLTTT